MTLRPCPTAQPCPLDQPLDNFSSEADDTLDFISTAYADGGPPLLVPWTGTACGVTYVSFISQLDADLHARALAETCAINHRNPFSQTFLNSAQTCCVPCPDGTQTCYQVPGGLFQAPTQAEADSLAHQVACDLVNRNKVCLGSVEACTCVGTPYLATITSNTPATFTIVGGSLPPGISFVPSSQSIELIGTPTVNGTYVFQIRAQTTAGPYMLKTFSIAVLQILTIALPSFTVGVPYSFQLQATGGSGNYAWKLTSGVLPTGITLNVSGLLSGTPSGSGTNPLVFQVTDQNCQAADQTFFPPSVTLSGQSTTTIGQILGFDEYIVSPVPKRYRRLTWSGTSEQQLFANSTRTYLTSSGVGNHVPATIEWNQIDGGCYSPSVNPGQTYNRLCQSGGAWSISFFSIATGDAQVYNNPSPSVAGTYSKTSGSDTSFPANFSITGPITITPGNQIGGAKYVYVGASEIDFLGNYLSTYSKNLSEMCAVADNKATIQAPDGVNVPFSGWIGPPGFEQCPPPGLPYTSQGDVAFKTGQGARFDVSGFWGGGSGVNFPRSAWSITDSTHLVSNDTGNATDLSYFDAPDLQSVPPFFGPFPGNVVWIHHYSATMDEEFTEAQALAVGTVFRGPGLVSAYLRSGFTVSQTSVIFTLTFSNLLIGRSYLASYQIFNSTLGTVQTVQLSFVANGPTNTVTNLLPVPSSGQAVIVRNPSVTFAQ